MSGSKSVLGRIQRGAQLTAIFGIGMLVAGLIWKKMEMVVSAAILIGLGMTVYAVTWANLRNRNSN